MIVFLIMIVLVSIIGISLNSLEYVNGGRIDPSKIKEKELIWCIAGGNTVVGEIKRMYYDADSDCFFDEDETGYLPKEIKIPRKYAKNKKQIRTNN